MYVQMDDCCVIKNPLLLSHNAEPSLPLPPPPPFYPIQRFKTVKKKGNPYLCTVHISNISSSGHPNSPPSAPSSKPT